MSPDPSGNPDRGHESPGIRSTTPKGPVSQQSRGFEWVGSGDGVVVLPDDRG